MCGLGVHIGPHIIRALVADLKVPLRNLISDKEETVLDVLTILPSAHPTVLCQQYGGLVVLIKDITVNRIPLYLHKILTPHHPTKNVSYTY